MRKFLLPLAAVGATLAVATPASAQYYGQPYGYEHGYGYGNAGDLQQRIYNVLRGLDGVRYPAREQLRAEAISLDRQLRYAARNGLNPYEARAFDVRIGRLEQRKGWASAYRGYGHDGYDGQRGYNGYDGYDYYGRGGGDWDD